MSKTKRRRQNPPNPPATTQNPVAQAVKQAIFPQQVVPSAFVVHQAWNGPIPSPEQLRQFDAVVPGLAERIVRMAEQEGEHTRSMQSKALSGMIQAQRLGQIMAALIALCGMGAAVWLALAGHDTVAGVLAGTTITTIVVAFLQARSAANAQ